jgi:hypothetical protein
MVHLGKHGLPGTRRTIHEDVAIDSSIATCVDSGSGQGSQLVLKHWLEDNASQRV